MRSTLDIDPDVFAAAKDIAKRDHLTAGRVLSELARKALTLSSQNRASEQVVRYGVPVIPAGNTPMTPERVSELMDEEGI